MMWFLVAYTAAVRSRSRPTGLTRNGHRHFPKNKAKNLNFEVSSPPGAE